MLSFFVSHTVFAAGCIGRMILQWVCIVSAHLSPALCLLLDALAESFFLVCFHFFTCFICLLALSLTGCLGQIILHLHVVSLGGRLGSMILQCMCLHFLSLITQMLFLLDALPVSFCITCFLHFLAIYVCTLAFLFLCLRHD